MRIVGDKAILNLKEMATFPAAEAWCEDNIKPIDQGEFEIAIEAIVKLGEEIVAAFQPVIEAYVASGRMDGGSSEPRPGALDPAAQEGS